MGGLTGRNAFIGVGFRDRADSFDLLVSIQDHFKYVVHFLSIFLAKLSH